jgi:quercetin dioxygenase-like cupin family protein
MLSTEYKSGTKTIMKRIIFILTAFILGGCVSNAATLNSAKINSSSEISRKVIERIDIAGSNEELRLMLIEYPPNLFSVPHIHPVGGLCYVVEGAAESQYEGEDLKTFKAGDSYQDIATKKHLLFRNVSKTMPLKFTCTAKIKKDQQYMLPI